MADAYPELLEAAERVNRVLDEEEMRFSRTVNIGLRKLEEDLGELLGKDVMGYITTQHLHSSVLRFREYPGEKAFKLYDTYGLPRDFIEDVCRDAGFRVDWTSFETAMQEQRTRARASWKGGHKDVANPVYAKLAERFRTEPDFYFGTTAKNRRIEAIVTKDGTVNELPAGAEGEIILDRTVFYAESGGQVSDIGTLWNNEHTMQVAEVRGAYYPVSGIDRAPRVAREKLAVGDRVAGDADGARREHIKRNHTANAPDARRAAQHSRHARQAGRLARRAGPSAFRFFAFRRDRSG